MILQALVRHYEDLKTQNLIAPPGWSLSKISYALTIDENGKLISVASLLIPEAKGNKKVPQQMNLPAPVKRASNIKPNFLWDNSAYILGFDGKGKPENAKKRFAAAKKFHNQLLANVDSDPARAVLKFFENWDLENAENHEKLQDYKEEMMKGANLVFRFRRAFVHEDPAIRQAWQEHYDNGSDSDEAKTICLVTGKEDSAQPIHPSIKGVQGAQSSGAALVSFNAPAFCSYGKEQNINAPTGKYASFAYTAALNHLLADRRHLFRVGDTTVLCWADSGNPTYQEVFREAVAGDENNNAEENENRYSEADMREAVKTLADGNSVEFDDTMLDPNKPFYVLGLAPNAARISVRFFLRNSFGSFLENVQAHYDRLEIVKPNYDKYDTLPIWRLLGETVNQKSKDKTPSPNMAGAVLRSILMNEPYPATLLNGALIRIRNEQKVTRGRAAIIKAYYLKLNHIGIPKEVLTVALNENSTNVPYTLGRMFSVLEDIQSSANPGGINTTIKDRYFNSASATPSNIFPVLLNLSQKHLKKLNVGKRIYLEKQLSELMGLLPESFPTRLNLPQQGAFQLGYYHQTQKRYEKKKEEETDNE